MNLPYLFLRLTLLVNVFLICICSCLAQESLFQNAFAPTLVSPSIVNFSFNFSKSKDYTPYLVEIQSKLNKIDMAIENLPKASKIYNSMHDISEANKTFNSYYKKASSNKTEIEITLKELDDSFTTLSEYDELREDPVVVERILLAYYLQNMYRKKLGKRSARQEEAKRYKAYFESIRPKLDSAIGRQREVIKKEALINNSKRIEICRSWGGTHSYWQTQVTDEGVLTEKIYDFLISFKFIQALNIAGAKPDSVMLGNMYDTYVKNFKIFNSDYKIINEKNILKEDGKVFKDRYRMLKFIVDKRNNDPGCTYAEIGEVYYTMQRAMPHYEAAIRKYNTEMTYLYYISKVQYQVLDMINEL